MRHQQGLTLVELLVTLAIMGVLVGVVFPGFQNMVARNGLATSANAMILAVSYARSEAVRDGGGVTLTAIDAADPANEWGPGYRVAAADGTLLRVFEAIPNDLTLDAPAGVTTMTFTGQGALTANAPVIMNLCLAGDSGVQLTVAVTGRPSTSSLDADDCP